MVSTAHSAQALPTSKVAYEDAALQEGVELVLHKLRQLGAGCGLGLLEESRGVLLHQAVQRGLFGAVALAVPLLTRRSAWSR